jgi:AcrR family transcriptional regulator
MSNQRQQQKADTARRIFTAALDLFTAQGYEATTVDQIARAAGVAKGTFFTHFPSKDAVLEHIGRLQMDRLEAAVAADPTFADRPARERLHALLATLAAGVEGQPAEMRALTVELLTRRSLFNLDRQGIDELDALLAGIVADGQARGEIRADAEAARLAAMVRGAYFLAFAEWLQRGAGRLAPLAAAHLDLLLDGIATS